MKAILRPFSSSIRGSIPSPSTPTRSNPFSSNFKNVNLNQVGRIPGLKNGTGKWPKFYSTQTRMDDLEAEEMEAEMEDSREIERVLGSERSIIERVPIGEKVERIRRVIESPSQVKSFQGDELLRPVIPLGEPTVEDLYKLKPRRFTVPTYDSPPAVRVVYLKTWTSTAAKLDKSFNKVQLRRLAGPELQGGLNLNTSDPRVAITSGKRKFAMKQKPIIGMSKNELIRLLMVLGMGLTPPEKLPSAKKLPFTTESIILSDRSLFLLLTPEGTTIKSLMTAHQVKLAFKRDSDTGELSMIIKGHGPEVHAAAEQVTALASDDNTQSIILPNLATTLRPESYQNISRLAKVFIEPGKTNNTILATATNANDQSQASQMISIAFVQNAIESSIPVFISLPTNAPVNNDTQNKLAFYPFTPTTLPSWSITAADTFARLQEIRSTRNLVESKEALELGSWARKMKFEHKVKRVPLDLNSTKTLTESLNSIDLEGELEIRGEFGNWLLPIFYDGKATKENRNVLAGNFNLESFRKWSNGKEAVFIANPPKGFLDSIGIYNSRLPPSVFDALVPSANSIASTPSISGINTRRLIYRPVLPIKSGEAIKRIEIDYFGNEQIEVRKFEEKRIRFVVPDGSSDYQISISSKLSLVLNNLMDFPTTEPSLPPSYLTYLSTRYILDLDLAIRTTSITTSTATGQTSISLKQERWTDEITGILGSRTEVVLGKSKSDGLSQRIEEGVAKMEELSRNGLQQK